MTDGANGERVGQPAVADFGFVGHCDRHRRLVNLPSTLQFSAQLPKNGIGRSLRLFE
jgi:hypothetical protein